jgi:hypothetical protein
MGRPVLMATADHAVSAETSGFAALMAAADHAVSAEASFCSLDGGGRPCSQRRDLRFCSLDGGGRPCGHCRDLRFCSLDGGGRPCGHCRRFRPGLLQGALGADVGFAEGFLVQFLHACTDALMGGLVVLAAQADVGENGAGSSRTRPGNRLRTSWCRGCGSARRCPHRLAGRSVQSGISSSGAGIVGTRMRLRSLFPTSNLRRTPCASI